MRPNERGGGPSALRQHATPVWVDLRALLDSGATAPDVTDGLLDEPCAGGLSRWLRASTGEWVGVVTYVVTLADGSTFKAADQLIPAHALRPR
jgi:hypothetical protein